MSFEITGKLIEKYDVTQISDKFKKREFVIEKKENSGGFDPFNPGDDLKVSFNIRGRKWEKAGTISYFTNLEAWRIEKINSESSVDTSSSFQNNEAPLPDVEDFSGSDNELDDLPF